MELNDCAFPTLAGSSPPTMPRWRSRTVDYALLVGARPRGPGMERKDLLRRTRRSSRAQGKALNEDADRNVKRAGGRQSGQHQRPDRAAQRAGPGPAQLHRDDASGSQPRAVAARREDRQRTSPTSSKHDDLGQSLLDAVSGHQLHATGQWQARASASSTATGTRTPSSPPCSSAAPRSSRRAAHRRPRRPRRPPSITCATGTSARPTATGHQHGASVRWQLWHPGGVIYSYPVTCVNGDYTIVQGLGDRRVLAQAHGCHRQGTARRARRRPRTHLRIRLAAPLAGRWASGSGRAAPSAGHAGPSVARKLRHGSWPTAWR